MLCASLLAILPSQFKAATLKNTKKPPFVGGYAANAQS